MIYKLSTCPIENCRDNWVDSKYSYTYTYIDTKKIISFTYLHNLDGNNDTMDFIINNSVVFRGASLSQYYLDSITDDEANERLDRVYRYYDCLANGIVKLMKEGK